MKRAGVRVIGQRRGWDCGIAALAMLLDKPYGDVSAAARELLNPRNGMSIKDAERVAAHLGKPVTRIARRRDYLDGQTGMLAVAGEGVDKSGHWVIVKAGAIIDPFTSRVWAIAEYMAYMKARPCTLLVAA